jgi:hypothetical protein
MKVAIEWTEEVSYRSVIEVDGDEVREWLESEADPASPLTGDQVERFLQASLSEEWFEQCDTSRDFVSVNDRTLDDVTIQAAP